MQWLVQGYSKRKRYIFMCKKDISSTCANNAPVAASEKMLQTHSVSAIMKLQIAGSPILFAGDMAGNRRTRSEQQWAKATGLVRGEPDLRVYGPRGRTLFIEWKTVTGVVSEHQAARHDQLANLGHTVVVLRATTGPEAAILTTQAITDWLAQGEAA